MQFYSLPTPRYYLKYDLEKKVKKIKFSEMRLAAKKGKQWNIRCSKQNVYNCLRYHVKVCALIGQTEKKEFFQAQRSSTKTRSRWLVTSDRRERGRENAKKAKAKLRKRVQK